MKNALIPVSPSATQLATQEDSYQLMSKILKRKNSDFYYLRFRVPVRYQSVETKGELWRSLKTENKKEALKKAVIVEQLILQELDARLAGNPDHANMSEYEHYVKIASLRGFSYKTAEQIAEGPIQEGLSRIEALIMNGDEPGSAAQKALLGVIDRPKLTISQVAESMGERFPQEFRDKNARQQRHWLNRWKRPTNKIIELLGHDVIFEDITRQNAMLLKDTLQKRVLNDELSGGSAQKDLQNIDLMWRKYFESLGVDAIDAPPSPFRGLNKGLSRNDEEGRKNEYPVDDILKLLEPGALDSLNEQARDIVFTLIETGCRQSEIYDIPASSIHLDEEIPYIEIKHETGENAREVKNKATRRKVPLVGVALEAMKRNPHGFPRYRATASFSGAVNKQLRALDLMPEGVTIGGLRHSFESRLKEIGIPNDDRGELMGHSVKRARGREHYGNVMSLEKRLEILKKIELSFKRLALPSP